MGTVLIVNGTKRSFLEECTIARVDIGYLKMSPVPNRVIEPELAKKCGLDTSIVGVECRQNAIEPFERETPE